MKGSKEKVVLGSGKVYTMLYTGTLPETFTEILKKVMTEENHTGWIKNGASVEYKPTMTTEKDDLGMVVKEILTDEPSRQVFSHGMQIHWRSCPQRQS